MKTLKEYGTVNLESVRAPQSEGSFVKLLNQEMEELLAKDKYERIKNHHASDIVILTKDEFHSMIKTDKEAEEYGQQCWNDGKAQGVIEFADFIKSQMETVQYHMGIIKYKQGVFSDCDIDDFVTQFNDRDKENNK